MRPLLVRHAEPRLRFAGFAEPCVEGELPGRRVEAENLDGVFHGCVPRHDDPLAIRRDREPMRHVGGIEGHAADLARRMRIADVEADHGTPGWDCDQVVMPDDRRNRAALGRLLWKRCHLPRLRCVTVQAVDDEQSAAERRHEYRPAIVHQAWLGRQRAVRSGESDLP